MKHHAMKETLPVTGKAGHRRFYIDGQRVPFFRYWKMDDAARRADSFRTQRVGDRWHFSKQVAL